ncbi:MAG: hypothetical protein HS119_11370 [Flavobacteriales bacterium]|nr:hypothetical protein [Flavobacteriales bacterium]
MKQTILIFLLLIFLIGNAIIGYHFYLRFTIDLKDLMAMNFEQLFEFQDKLKSTIIVGGSLIGCSGVLAFFVIPARI